MSNNQSFKRISKGLWNYALFPANIDKQELIEKNGKYGDFYESIYNYKEQHYDDFINGLKKGCEYTETKFDEQNLFKTESQVRRALKEKIKNGDKTADKIKSQFSVAGTQDIQTHKLVFDFDSENDIQKAKNDTLEVVGRLIKEGFTKDAIRLCYSGSKGFSVEVVTDTNMYRKQFETLVEKLSKGLDTFDESVKDEQRLFRIPMTKHNKSGMYKIPLTIDELSELDTDQIKQQAESKYVKDNWSLFIEKMKKWSVNRLPDHLKHIEIKEESTTEDQESFVFSDRLELSRKPKFLSSTKFALQEGFFEQGNRNEALMILCTTYKAHGFPKEITYRILKGAAELQAKRTKGEVYPKSKIWTEIINHVYSESWRGGTYSEAENNLLKKTAEKFNLSIDAGNQRLTNLQDGLVKFKEFGKNISKNTIKTGVDLLDENILITTQMTVGLLGAPSSGKTGIALNFMENVLEAGEGVLFESLDMGEMNIVGRFLSKHTGYSYQDILYMLENGIEDKKLSKAWDVIEEKYKNLGVCYRSGTNVEDIENDIIEYGNRTGKKPKLVIIDYLEKVRGPYSDDTQNSGYVASRLSDLATEHDLCMVLLLQPQKSAGDPSEPLTTMRKVKGSSKIEQDCRVIMTVWRPGFNPEDTSDDKFASIAVVKNNMGLNCKLDFAWDGASGRLRTMTEEEVSLLEDVRNKAVARKKAKLMNDDIL